MILQGHSRVMFSRGFPFLLVLWGSFQGISNYALMTRYVNLCLYFCPGLIPRTVWCYLAEKMKNDRCIPRVRKYLQRRLWMLEQLLEIPQISMISLRNPFENFRIFTKHEADIQCILSMIDTAALAHAYRLQHVTFPTRESG